MNKRYNFTLYSIVFFISFLMVFLYPDSFISEEDDKNSVIILSVIIILITGFFLIYKTIKWVKEPDEEDK